MAGFMAGFAGALTDGINDRKKRKAEREDDVFRMSYQSYLSNKDSMKASKEKDRAAAANAELMAAGTANPEEAYKAIYQTLINGGDAKLLAESLKENDIKIIDTPEAAKVDKIDSVSVDGQMSEAMPTPSGVEAPGQTAPTADTKISGPAKQESNWFAEMFSNEDSNVDKYRNSAIKKIADATGQDYDTVAKTITGDYRSAQTDPVKFVFQKRDKNEELQTYEKELYKLKLAELDGNPADIAKARLRVSVFTDKALLESSLDSRNNVRMATTNEAGEYGGSVDIAQSDIIQARENGLTEVKTVDGRMVPMAALRSVDEKYLENRMKVFEKFGTQTEDYNKSLAAYTSVATIGNKLIRYGRENPDILTSTAGASATIQGWVNDIQGAVNIFDKQFGENVKNGVYAGSAEDRAAMMSQLEEASKKAATQMSDILTDATKSDADRYAAYQNLQTLMVYQIAAMDLQTGKSLTIEEMENYKELSRAKDPVKLEARINETLLQKYSDLQTQGTIQNNNPMIKNLEVMGGGIKSGLSVITPDQLAERSNNVDLQQRQAIIRDLNAQQTPINYENLPPEAQPQETKTRPEFKTNLESAEWYINEQGVPIAAVIKKLEAGGDTETANQLRQKYGVK
jgi:hypothetical protein